MTWTKSHNLLCLSQVHVAMQGDWGTKIASVGKALKQLHLSLGSHGYLPPAIYSRKRCSGFKSLPTVATFVHPHALSLELINREANWKHWTTLLGTFISTVTVEWMQWLSLSSHFTTNLSRLQHQNLIFLLFEYIFYLWCMVRNCCFEKNLRTIY